MAPRLGIIGGSGFPEATAFAVRDSQQVETPHGPPSSDIELGDRVAFLPRHGADHRIPAHQINHRANLWALRETDVSAVLATSSVGSLQVETAPRTLVVPEDYVSLAEIPTYFDDEVRHITPSLDGNLRRQLVDAARRRGSAVQDGGIYVQTRGPRLETKAEIRVLQRFGDVVGMTMASEATLAQELDLPYASLCSVDNYAHGVTKEPLTFEDIRRTQESNRRVVQSVIQAFVEAVP